MRRLRRSRPLSAPAHACSSSRRREFRPPTLLNGADSSIRACLPSPARSCPLRPHRPHPAGTLIVATKARIDSLDALRGSPAMVLNQGDYIQLPPAAIGDKAGMAEACGESPRRVAAS